MTSYDVLFSKKSQKDLIEIWKTIAPENSIAADKIVDELEVRINQLKHFPQLGASRSDINIKYRQLVEGRYLILYQCIEEQKTVKIIRIIHSARDIRQIF